jgi:hypothetical protein
MPTCWFCCCYFRNFVRVSSGPELGAYYHEFFLRDKPQLAAQMFCKNARTKIAMATPAPSASSNPNSQPSETAAAQSNYEAQILQQKMMGGVDAAQLFLTGQGMDPQTQLLLQQEIQQMKSMKPQSSIQNLLQQSTAMGMMDNGLNSNMNLFQGPNVNALALQQMQAQKQQQVRMFQLQQLMAMNLQRQQKRTTTSNNFRASAA